MHKTILTVALMGAFLPAQETFSVSGFGTRIKTETRGDATVSFVSRDAGRTWAEQGSVDTKLHIRFGTFDPRNPAVIPGKLFATPANRLFIVQFKTPIIGEFRAVLNGMGAELHTYLPSQSYLVRMDRTMRDEVERLSFVRSVTDYHTAFRLDPEIIAGLGDGSGEKVRYTVVFVDKRRDARGLETRIQAEGADLLIRSAGGILCEASMTEQQMLAIANDDRTLWIAKWTAPEVDIDNARIQGGTNYVETKAGIEGIGMTGHIMEGVYATHTEFAAIAGVRGAPIGLFDASGSGHGTNTAGEIYARGANSTYRGLMPKAQMTYTNYNYVINKSTRYGVTTSMINNNKVMLDTASWGYARTLLYTDRSAEMDDIIFDHDIYITQSQSNAGGTSQPRNSRSQAWAKNIASVGGFRHGNNSNPADDYWGRSGSIGPASDGRIGVTLSAYYDSIGTTSGSSSGYTTGFGGTSGATPIINGLSGNAIEMFTDGLFGYGTTAAKTAAERFKVLPHFTTTKSLLIATATQLTYNSSGTSTGANRYQQGWGFPSLTRLYDERDRLLVIDELDVLQQGQSRIYYVFAKGGRFVASMNHADPQAAANASIHRINSVDLQVKTAGGTTYWGNNGLLTGATSTAGGSANDRDTEETVILTNAPVGLTEVTVRATGVRQDGHVETSTLDIDYALVVQGICGNRDTTGMKLDVNSASPGNLTVSLTSLPSGWARGFTLFSLATKRPVSTGDLFGLEVDGLAYSLLRLTPTTGDIFAFTSGASSTQYPNAPFVFPVGVANAVSGLTLDSVAFVMDSTAKILAVSNVERESIK